MGNCTNCVQSDNPQRTNLSTSSSFDNLSRSYHRNHFLPNRFRTIRTFSPYNLNTLIDETLSIIRTVVDNDQEPPHAMLVVSRIASREDRWLDVMMALIDRVPINDPLGATVIALLLDECPLPSRELLHQLIKRVCSDNRSRIKILQNIIEEYIQENSKSINETVQDSQGIESAIPGRNLPSTTMVVEQQEK